MGAKEEHAKKVKQARKMITLQEVKDGVELFNSKAWNEHVAAKQRRAQKRLDAIRKRKSAK